MPTIPFVPGAQAGTLIWKHNCDTQVGPIGCIPAAPDPNRTWVAWCDKGEVQFTITLDIEEIAGISGCYRVPPDRRVNGVSGQLQACPVQDAPFFELVGQADPVVNDDPASGNGFALNDEIGYAFKDFTAVGCVGCGSSCDYLSMLMWLCVHPLTGCALPPGTFAVLAVPSFKVAPSGEDIVFGGGRRNQEEITRTFDVIDIGPNTNWFPCTETLPAPNRGPIIAPGTSPILPMLAGLVNSPAAVWLTNVPPPVGCDCCGEAGFWSGDIDGDQGGGGLAGVPNTIQRTIESLNLDAIAAANAAADEAAAAAERAAEAQAKADEAAELAGRLLAKPQASPKKGGGESLPPPPPAP